MPRWNKWMVSASSAAAGAGAAVLYMALASPSAAMRDAPSEPQHCEPMRRLDAPPRALERVIDTGRPTPPTYEPSTPAAFSAPRLTPEQRKAMLMLRYGGIMRELALTQEQSARLLSVLSDQSEARSHQRRTATEPRELSEIAQAIGSTKAEAFAQLQATIPARQEVRRVRDELEEAGEPMSAEQHRALVELLAGQEAGAPPLGAAGESLEQTAARYRAWADEREHALRENAATVLSPTQLEALDQNNALRERARVGSGARVLRGAAGAGG